MNTQSLPPIDVHRYEGEWYVIGSKPSKRSRRWINTRGRYEWNDDRNHFDVMVTYRMDQGGPLYSANMRLHPVKNSNNAHYKVRVWLFGGIDYVIYKIADDYSHVLIGHPRKKHLFIIARKQLIDNDVYHQLIDFAVSLGYSPTEIEKHVQDPQL